MLISSCSFFISGTIVDVANINSASQVVLSGSIEGLSHVAKIAKEKRWGEDGGAIAAKRCTELNVSGAFHSRLMSPAMEEFSEALLSIAPSFGDLYVPLVANVTGDLVDRKGLEEAMRAQMLAPVRCFTFTCLRV